MITIVLFWFPQRCIIRNKTKILQDGTFLQQSQRLVVDCDTFLIVDDHTIRTVNVFTIDFCVPLPASCNA